MSLIFRSCTADDVDDVIPLMYSAGPDAYRYTFSVSSKLQVLDFLRVAFIKGEGEFGYKDHIVAEDNGEIVALVGMRSAQDNVDYTLAVAKTIFSFYGIFNGLRVAIRGLRFERVVSPPHKGVLCLHNLGVKEGLRGQGYGQKLIAHFLDKASERNEATVGLDVAETNPRAKALYLRLGFTVKSATYGGFHNKYGKAVAHEYMEYSLKSKI